MFVPQGAVACRAYGRPVQAPHESGGVSSAYSAAAQLAAHLSAGGPIPVVPSPITLDPGEVLHARLDAEGWRYSAVDVAIGRKRVIAGAGFFTLGLGATANTLANRRAMAEARRLARPQWRALGVLQVLATNQRLLVLHDGAWASVWYSAICHIVPRAQDAQLELQFADDPPYLLCGEWVPYLSVLVAAVVADVYGVAGLEAFLRQT